MGFGVFSRSIHLALAGGSIDGDLSVPDRPLALVLLTKLSGSQGPAEVAAALERRGYATLVLNTCGSEIGLAIASEIDWADIHPALARRPVCRYDSGALSVSTGQRA